MHEQKPTTDPISLETRMRLALNRIKAACPDSKGASIQFEVDSCDDKSGYSFYARIHQAEGCYGFGDTADAAADGAIKAYGSSESRRAAKIKRLEEEAASLGLVVTNSAPPSATQAD